MTLDHHHLAIVSLCGSAFDVFGALYLAYDLLGGRHGPLRTLTRAVTYSVLYGVLYGLPLGIPFGLAAGVTTGVTVALELAEQSRAARSYAFTWELAFSAVRAAGYAVGASFIYGSQFGAAFGLLSFAGQSFAYRRGIRPGMDYEARRAYRITRRQLLAAVNRTVGYAIAGYLSAAVAHHQMHALMFGLRAGLAIGIATAFGTAVAPYIEWLSENVPERSLGALGIVSIFIGFTLQSMQYWVALFDVQVR
jgi:hypothetical protein